jgi:hypothetical protein
MLHLSIYVVNDVVVWRLWKPRPAAQWRTLGPSYWERRGEVVLTDDERTDRQLLTAALEAIQNRLGER